MSGLVKSPAVVIRDELQGARIQEPRRSSSPNGMVRAFLAALADPELDLSAEQLEAAPRVAARLIRARAADCCT
jgi:hypothetical protein